MLTDGLTLEELSQRTGVEPRTLRSWVSEGLLAPPFRTGRSARYPNSNADRALAIRALKELHGLTLSAIGRRLMMATAEQIREWALEAGPTIAPSDSAREYLRQIQAHSSTNKQRSGFTGNQNRRANVDKLSWKPRRFNRSDQRLAELASIERLILQIEKVLGTPVPRRSRGVVWTRIAITSDLELSIRGTLEPRERALFEQLADQFRTILTGRTYND